MFLSIQHVHCPRSFTACVSGSYSRKPTREKKTAASCPGCGSICGPESKNFIYANDVVVKISVFVQDLITSYRDETCSVCFLCFTHVACFTVSALCILIRDIIVCECNCPHALPSEYITYIIMMNHSFLVLDQWKCLYCWSFLHEIHAKQLNQIDVVNPFCHALKC